MTVVDERGTRPATVALPPVDGSDLALEALLATSGEAGARRTLRDQIARLEHLLAIAVAADPVAPTTAAARGRAPEPATPSAPRLLDLAALERVRDDLVGRVDGVRSVVAERERAVRGHRARLEAMLADPAAHRGELVTGQQLGLAECVRWRVRPLLGPVGRLAGWWRVRMSSGCP